MTSLSLSPSPQGATETILAVGISNFMAFNGLPSWSPVAAIIPAILATILFFVDQHITSTIVNRKDNKLKVGGWGQWEGLCGSG